MVGHSCSQRKRESSGHSGGRPVIEGLVSGLERMEENDGNPSRP